MAMMNKKVAVVLKLPQLQNLIKRDPSAYKEEFLMQKRHFESELEIFKMRPTQDSERFTDLVTFMSHVIACYKKDTTEIPASLVDLLENHAMTLHADVRAKLLQALILLRSKNVVDPLLLLRLSFRMFSVPDKALRIMLGDYIVNDIKSINASRHNDKLNRNVQSMLFDIVQEDNSIAARKTVQILSELYRKRVWTDARCVNVLGTACTSSITRVSVAGINFFLGIETKMHEDEDEEKKTVNDINYHQHSKKTRKRQRQVEKQMTKNSKLRKEAENSVNDGTPLFPAIQLLHDPQSLAETVFKKVHKSGEKFEVKLLMLNFVSRLIGCHKLIILNFYSFLQRYLTSHQKEVTKVLAYLIQACHDLVPPEELLPVVKAIAHHFITERCSTEVLAVGLNAVREIFVRVPALLKEPDMADFVQDLVQYGKKSHKSVMMAAHGILNFVRETYPSLLRQRDRGKYHNISNVPGGYGEQKASETVPGSELLEAYEKGEIYLDDEDNIRWAADDGKVEESDEEGDEDEWEEVSEGSAPELVDMKSDDEGEWESVSNDSDEDEEEEDEEDNGEEMDEEEEEVDDEESEHESEDGWKEVSDAENEGENDDTKKTVRRRIEAKRLLTNEDFELLGRLRAANEQRLLDPRNRRLSRSQADEDEEETNGQPAFSVDPDSLGPGSKVSKTSKIERMTKILEGRRDSKFELGGHAGGLTNKEKERKKNFVMVRKGKREVKGKINKSNSDLRYEKMHQREQFGRDKRKRRRT